MLKTCLVRLPASTVGPPERRAATGALHNTGQAICCLLQPRARVLKNVDPRVAEADTHRKSLTVQGQAMLAEFLEKVLQSGLLKGLGDT